MKKSISSVQETKHNNYETNKKARALHESFILYIIWRELYARNIKLLEKIN